MSTEKSNIIGMVGRKGWIIKLQRSNQAIKWQSKFTETIKEKVT